MKWSYESETNITPRRTKVYFIQADNGGPIKIGYTEEDPVRRAASLQTGNPYRLTVLAWVWAPKSKEAELHKQFSAARLEGEWFSPVPELLALIENLRGAR